jgi:proline iminopeptidase
MYMVLTLVIGVAGASCSEPAPESESGPSVTPEVEVQEGFVEAGDGVRLFYRTVGSADDTMVVVHGGPGLDMEYFAADLQPLADEITLVFYDQRGGGRSSLVRDSAQLDARWFAEDLESVRRHFGLERMTILGHSWGTGVAALYGMQYPDRIERLVLVGGVPLRREALVQGFEAMAAGRDSVEGRELHQAYEAHVADPGDYETCRAYYELWFRPFFADTAAASRSRGDFCAASPEAARNHLENVARYTEASLGDWDWRGLLDDVSAPTLVIHGAADPLPLESAREWARALPDARLLVLEGVGHFPYLEVPEAFFSAVTEFVRGEWPAEAEALSNP